MIIKLESYDSYSLKMINYWLEMKKAEIVDEPNNFEMNYKENQVLNILGKVSCIENSLK